ncbi:MAG: hypothetical protein N3E40_00065 [Dehalococcoidia bacterium]|nr:hypothetical protein [Dehalococcoidia bacterium]
MSLIEVLKKGIEEVSANPANRSWYEGAEGDAIVLRFAGLGSVTIRVRQGKLLLEKGEAADAKGVAEVEPAVFHKFIDGSLVFGGMFVHEMGQYFRPIRGEFYDFGGDFFLLNPVTQLLSTLYRSSQAFKQAVDACK